MARTLGRRRGRDLQRHYVLLRSAGARGLAAGVNGGGGQIGNWTGPRSNYAGELIQLGVRKRAEEPMD